MSCSADIGQLGLVTSRRAKLGLSWCRLVRVVVVFVLLLWRRCRVVRKCSDGWPLGVRVRVVVVSCLVLGKWFSWTRVMVWCSS